MKTKTLSLLIAVILALSHPTLEAVAYQSQGFFKKGDYWYDSWDVNRNSAGGNDGYLPNVVYESLGHNRELAYNWGRWFLNEYSNQVTRAENIMKFVQAMVKYKYDEENPFILAVTNNEKQEEWAWNPDELAHIINITYNNGEVAHGDCEDFAFLLTVIYMAAEYDVTIVDAPRHIALMIWLPEYPNANVYWDIDDGRGAGWIWVEATGDKNRLGWTPDDFKNSKFNVQKLETGLFLMEIQSSGFDCMVSIATLGSELYSEVQFIREFRDKLIEPTFVGSQFASVFNAWYYSFSPEVSVFIAEDPLVKEFMKFFLYPLMGIMRLSYFVYQLFAFDTELGAFTAILTASSLIGVIYFSLPIMMIITLIRRSKGSTTRRNLLRVIVFLLLVSLALTGISEFTNVSLLMTFSIAMLVLSTISASALTVSIGLAEKILHK